VQAIDLIDTLCDVMGRALFNATAMLDLQRISLGGSVFWHNQDYLLPRLQAFMHGKLPALTNGLQIVPAGLGERVGDLAALALVMR
jgi:glucokinase